MTWELRLGDCVELMAEMPEASVDAIVTDPPYGLEFMGREWDAIGRLVGPGGKRRERETAISSRGDGKWQPGSTYGVPAKNPRCQKCSRLRFDHEGRKCSCEVPSFHARGSEYGVPMQEWHQRWATQALRVLKPGGHLLAFGGTRTYHRLVCAIEDAGFEIRDTLVWMYGSGFPKSLDISKAIDKMAGAEREVVGRESRPYGYQQNGELWRKGNDITAPATPQAQQWQGWGTALKPAHEPIVLARKPLSERNVAANVQRWGTGGINVDGGRLPATDKTPFPVGDYGERGLYGKNGERTDDTNPAGRWPPNVALDEEAAAMLDEQSGERGGSGRASGPTLSHLGDNGIYGKADGDRAEIPFYADSGGASRFMYVAKADREERERGLEHLRRSGTSLGMKGRGLCAKCGRQRVNVSGECKCPEPEWVNHTNVPVANNHPTVKPVALMSWLCKLICPPGGTVLDPFAGSGSTGIAALREGFNFLGMEQDAEYVEIAKARIQGDAPLFNMEAP